jgi:hypothetical protein
MTLLLLDRFHVSISRMRSPVRSRHDAGGLWRRRHQIETPGSGDIARGWGPPFYYAEEGSTEGAEGAQPEKLKEIAPAPGRSSWVSIATRRASRSI